MVGLPALMKGLARLSLRGWPPSSSLSCRARCQSDKCLSPGPVSLPWNFARKPERSQEEKKNKKPFRSLECGRECEPSCFLNAVSRPCSFIQSIIHSLTPSFIRSSKGLPFGGTFLGAVGHKTTSSYENMAVSVIETPWQSASGYQ